MNDVNNYNDKLIQAITQLKPSKIMVIIPIVISVIFSSLSICFSWLTSNKNNILQEKQVTISQLMYELEKSKQDTNEAIQSIRNDQISIPNDNPNEVKFYTSFSSTDNKDIGILTIKNTNPYVLDFSVDILTFIEATTVKAKKDAYIAVKNEFPITKIDNNTFDIEIDESYYNFFMRNDVDDYLPNTSNYFTDLEKYAIIKYKNIQGELVERFYSIKNFTLVELEREKIDLVNFGSYANAISGTSKISFEQIANEIVKQLQ